MKPHRFGDIAAFVAVVKAGSLTAAATSLGLTRSAVGKSIMRLETQLGVRLLNRTTRRLSLTDEGEVVYERWRQIMEELEDVDAAIALRHSKPTGTLKLVTPPSFGQRHMLPVLNAYLEQWPELRAELWFTDRFVDLVEEGFDVAICIGEPKHDSLFLTRTVAWQQFIVCASPGYLAKRGSPQAPSDLANHDTIMYLSAGQPRAWFLQAYDKPHVYDGPGRLNIDSSEVVRESALAGFGLAHIANYVVCDDLRTGSLVEVLHAYRPPPDPIRLVYPSKKHLALRTRAFVDLLVQRWQAGAPWELGHKSGS
ncbi:MAG TPA: LysR family transcriptional regulator [Dyella sp.]|uniref:LysR family transcriptional regulator n=1 Tax=Dyella sp. TaxID=1869338 RepID=UPI002D78E1B5|nr:LysR family transcriptional regulator [Dyella sp.]HET6552796.1 LysR family transcriptional regulator [Dyella sp.]